MKRHAFAGGLLAGLVLLAFVGGGAGAQTASKSATGSEADRAAVAAVFADYARFVANGDFDGFLALHDRDAYKMPQDQPMFQIWASADKLRQVWAKRSASSTIEMRADVKETGVIGDYAYAMGTYYMTVAPKAGGKPMITDGKFLTVLHRDSSGSWKILRDCYNNNIPAAG